MAHSIDNPSLCHRYAAFCCQTRSFCALTMRFANQVCGGQKCNCKARPMRRDFASHRGFGVHLVCGSIGLGHLAPFLCGSAHTGPRTLAFQKWQDAPEYVLLYWWCGTFCMLINCCCFARRGVRHHVFESIVRLFLPMYTKPRRAPGGTKSSTQNL